MQLAMENSINIEDDDNEEEKREEEKNLPEEECWIFKRNKNFVEHTSSKLGTCEQEASEVIDRYAEHQKFLARLRAYQESLPFEKTIKPATITQVTNDIGGEMRNLFVNNTVPDNRHKVNVKAIMASVEKKDPVSLIGRSNIFADLDTNSIFSNTVRSARLSRKCKKKSTPTPFAFDVVDEDDEDDLLSQYEPQTKLKTKGKRHLNGEAGKSTQSIVEMVREDWLRADKTNLSETVSSSMLQTKKQKIDGKLNPKVEPINISNNKNASAHSQPKPDNTKVYPRKKVNGVAESQIIDDVIQIGGDNEENDETNAATKVASSVNCPMCNKLFPVDNINDHAYTCQGPQTQTRSKLTSGAPTFDPTAWTNAVKGLSSRGTATVTEIKEPVMDIPSSVKSENKIRTRPQEKLKLTNSKDPLKEVKCPSKLDNKAKTMHQLSEVQKTRLLDTRTSGVVSGLDQMDKSTQELLQGYAVTMQKVRNPSKAKQMRIFDESNSEELTQCARCDQCIPDKLLKLHTDQCLEKSLIVE